MALSYTTVLTRKGQTTIPAELRAKLGLKEGDRLLWWIEDDTVHVMGAREYARRMSARFEAQRDPSRTPLTIEELKAARAEAWTHRHDRAAVEQ
jgi:antitoxin PrlF